MISTSNVTLRVGKKALFEDVNIKFTEGNCYGLIGANGAGKSTFLKILSGQLEPTNGEVIITPGERLSFLQQDHFKYDEYPVLDTVMMGNARLYEIMKEKEAIYAKEDFTDEDGMKASELEGEFAAMNGWEAESDAATLLNGLGIPVEMHYEMMKNLNGPEKVKVLLAQALFGNPDILLLDEPLSALDAWSRTAIGEELREIQRKSGVTTLMVTHDRTEALTLSDYVAVLHDGKLEDFGTPDELYEHPKSAFSATFVGDMNLLTLPTSNGTVGIRYADVKLSEPTEQTISAPESFVGKVQRLEFRGDMLRAHVLLNDFKTTVTADVVRVEHPWLSEGALLVVHLPEARWCRW